MRNYSKKIDYSLLWNQIISGNEKAFHQLFEEQYPILMLFGLRIRLDKELVKDMIQDLFLDLWKRHKSLPKVENINAYLKQILKRKIIKAVEKKSKVFPKDLPLADSKSYSYESFLVKQQTEKAVKDKLQKAFEELTKGQKEIIQLRFYKGLSYDEIADQLDIKKRTVYNQMHSAIQILKKYMVVCFLFFLP